MNRNDNFEAKRKIALEYIDHIYSEGISKSDPDIAKELNDANKSMHFKTDFVQRVRTKAGYPAGQQQFRPSQRVYKLMRDGLTDQQIINQTAYSETFVMQRRNAWNRSIGIKTGDTQKVKTIFDKYTDVLTIPLSGAGIRDHFDRFRG